MEKQGLDGKSWRAKSSRRRVDHETLRQAAEQAKEYYATDPEAREWAEFAGDTSDYAAPAVNPPHDD